MPRKGRGYLHNFRGKETGPHGKTQEESIKTQGDHERKQRRCGSLFGKGAAADGGGGGGVWGRLEWLGGGGGVSTSEIETGGGGIVLFIAIDRRRSRYSVKVLDQQFGKK